MGFQKQESFSVPSTIGAIDSAVARITEFAKATGFGESEVFGIDMAARESVANAAKHGNKLDATKPVEISLFYDGSSLCMTIRDHGEGFRPDEVPDPTRPENLLKASGRGILFIRNFVDEADWSPHPDGGTVVSLRKNL